jgi:hypothetical protein
MKTVFNVSAVTLDGQCIGQWTYPSEAKAQQAMESLVNLLGFTLAAEVRRIQIPSLPAPQSVTMINFTESLTHETRNN